jgi:hypothetical protein
LLREFSKNIEVAPIPLSLLLRENDIGKNGIKNLLALSF